MTVSSLLLNHKFNCCLKLQPIGFHKFSSSTQTASRCRHLLVSPSDCFQVQTPFGVPLRLLPGCRHLPSSLLPGCRHLPHSGCSSLCSGSDTHPLRLFRVSLEFRHPCCPHSLPSVQTPHLLFPSSHIFILHFFTHFPHTASSSHLSLL